MAKSGGEGKVSNGLVAVSCAAVLAIYTAGYSRTRDAAQKFETQSQERRSATRSEPTTPAVQPHATIIEPSDAAPQQTQEPNAPSVRSVAVSPSASEQTERVPQEIDTPSATPAPAPVETEVATAPLAVAPAPAPEPAAPPAPKWKDGTYTGWGTSRHGDIEARVVIKDGRIVESGISQCLTRYSCDVIDLLISQPVQRQSPNIDYVSRATESSDAYYFALTNALGEASSSQ